MRFNKVREYLSSQRIDRYRIAASTNKGKAITLYKANLRIAQSFHPLLGVLEVILRNCINSVLTSHFSDTDWIINQKAGFMADPSLTYLDRSTGKHVINDFLKASVEKSERKFKRHKVRVTSSKIIADQSFGFWTDLFEAHHYRLLLGRPIQVFGHLPSGYGRSNVCDKLHTIRQFRNRINHNEPVCFNGAVIDFTYAEEVYDAIMEILTWIDPELIKWTKDLDTVRKNIVIAKTI